MTTTIKIRTTVLKTLLLLGVMNLTFACSETNNNPPKVETTTPTVATPAKAPDTISIGGTVTAVTFGKDGYTANVQIDGEGSYAALVSIVNLGGPANYATCAVGDKASFQGIPTYSADGNQLKVTKIINIASTESIDLSAKYSKIKPEDYCWQANKVIDLHTQPSAESKVEGKHFAGEVLKVLGTKTVKNQLWVNVAYQLKVKAGYEDQFADGRVTPSGQPTGWIGGAETPKINCK